MNDTMNKTYRLHCSHSLVHKVKIKYDRRNFASRLDSWYENLRKCQSKVFKMRKDHLNIDKSDSYEATAVLQCVCGFGMKSLRADFSAFF